MQKLKEFASKFGDAAVGTLVYSAIGTLIVGVVNIALAMVAAAIFIDTGIPNWVLAVLGIFQALTFLLLCIDVAGLAVALVLAPSSGLGIGSKLDDFLHAANFTVWVSVSAKFSLEAIEPAGNSTLSAFGALSVWHLGLFVLAVVISLVIALAPGLVSDLMLSRLASRSD